MRKEKGRRLLVEVREQMRLPEFIRRLQQAQGGSWFWLAFECLAVVAWNAIRGLGPLLRGADGKKRDTDETALEFSQPPNHERTHREQS